MNRDVPKGLIIIAIIVGSILFFGSTVFRISNNHSDYVKTTATYSEISDYKISDEGKKMYYLKYKYIVNEQEYYYTTDYTVGYIPLKGSKITIKYNPNDPSKVQGVFDTFSIFQIIGIFFLTISLMILFSNLVWLRDIILFLGTISLILIIIPNHINIGIIIVLIILGVILFASIMDFISFLKNNKFEPLTDIKKEKNKSKQIRLIKKEEKCNLTLEEMDLKKKKSKRIKIGILLLLLLPLDIFISAKGWYPNNTIYMIASVIASLCFFAGFFITGMTLTGVFDNKDATIVIAGKVVDNEDIKNRKHMTLKEKIKAFNVIGIIMRIIAIPLFIGIILFVTEDPLNFFNSFSNVGAAQILAILGLVLITNILYIIFNKNKISIFSIIMFIICIILVFLYVLFNVIS